MANNDNFEAKITGTFQGDVFQNVLHFQQTSGTGGITATIGNLIDAVIANHIAKMMATMTDQVKFESVRVVQVGVNKPNLEKRGLNGNGTVTADALPAQDAVLFVKRANTGGRENVGKFFLCGVDDTLASGGMVDVSNAGLVAMAVQLKTNITSGGMTFTNIIWHRGPKTAEFITRVEIRQQIGRQNRRHLPVY